MEGGIQRAPRRGRLGPRGARVVVTGARSRPRRDVLQAERRAERPRDSFGGGLVGAATRECQEVRRMAAAATVALARSVAREIMLVTEPVCVAESRASQRN